MSLPALSSILLLRDMVKYPVVKVLIEKYPRMKSITTACLGEIYTNDQWILF